MSAIIYLSNGETLTVNEGDMLTPIVKTTFDGIESASIGKPIEIYSHIHNGLIPSLMELFCHHDFFYLNDDFSTAYSTKSVAKITT